jgi:hypothetical protein
LTGGLPGYSGSGSLVDFRCIDADANLRDNVLSIDHRLPSGCARIRDVVRGRSHPNRNGTGERRECGGSVVSHSGRASGGMDVRLFHRFGGFGSESTVAVVDPEGRFEIARVPPGWYRLTVAPRLAASNGEHSESATRLIEVQDKDIDGLLLALGTGASISGRVVAEPGAGVQSAVGMRVSASPTATLEPREIRRPRSGNERISKRRCSAGLTGVRRPLDTCSRALVRSCRALGISLAR